MLTRFVPKMLYVLIMLLLMPVLSCCAGPRLEYEDPDPALVGKVIRFKIPIVYLDFSDPRDAEQYGFLYPYYKGEKIVRDITRKSLAEDLNGTLFKYPREEVEEGIEFTIVGSYWHREDWFTREFAGDMHNVVLRDGKGVLSSCLSSFISNEAIFSTLGDHDEQP